VQAGTNDGSMDYVVARWNSDGSPDTTFDGDGEVQTDVGVGVDGTSRNLTVQLDGKILLTGTGESGADKDFLTVRYNADGSLDTGFGVGGILRDPVSSKDDIG